MLYSCGDRSGVLTLCGCAFSRLYGEGGSLAMRSTDGRHLAATGSRQSTN